jgi:membrane-bound serine protease (ClpP class)
MKNEIKHIALILMLLLGTSLVTVAQDTTPPERAYKVYKFDIKENIAPPVWRTTKKAIEEAEDMQADIVLVHMNTYGGMVDAADSIRTKILECTIPVYVYIDNNAASAGSLIAIACDSIYMNPVASIGAATVVDQSGQPVPDKYQSYMRSWMRATAEANGRDPDIAQAMVDPDIYIEGVVDTGKVLTLTTSEAMKYGFCEAEAESIRDIMDHAGIKEYEVIKQELTGMDKVIGFLVNPIVSGLLIMIIIGGIYFELQTPGVGFPIVASIIAALLYFAPLYLEGLANHWEILIFIAGIVLIAVEIFAIPGFGVAGISGIVLIVAGLTLSLVGNVGWDFSGVPLEGILKAFFIVVIAIFLSLLLSFFISKQMFTTTIFGHLALDTVQNVDEGYTSADKVYKSMLGQQGTAFTVLRPAGKVKIGNDVYDATAISGFIEKGEAVEVVSYQTGQLFVRKAEKTL